MLEPCGSVFRDIARAPVVRQHSSKPAKLLQVYYLVPSRSLPLVEAANVVVDGRAFATMYFSLHINFFLFVEIKDGGTSYRLSEL